MHPELAGRRVLSELRYKKPDPDLAGLDEIGDPRVDRLLCACGHDARKQSRHENRKLPDHQMAPSPGTIL